MQMGEWISAKVRRPEKDLCVIVTLEHKGGWRSVGDTAYFDGLYWRDLNGERVKVVAWMPFPEPYEGD